MTAKLSDIEESVRLAILPHGDFDPLGTYLQGGKIKYVQSWLEESLAQSMTPEKWKELSELLRGSFNDQAAKRIRDVAEAYARRCAERHFP